MSPNFDKMEMKTSSYGPQAKFLLLVMLLNCAINHQLHSLCAGLSVIKASFFALYDVAFDFKARINPQVPRTCNVNGVTGF